MVELPAWAVDLVRSVVALAEISSQKPRQLTRWGLELALAAQRLRGGQKRCIIVVVVDGPTWQIHATGEPQHSRPGEVN